MSIYEKFQNTAFANLEKEALFFKEQSFTYKDLLRDTRKLAFSLRKVGVGKGMHVGLLLPNSVEFIVSYLAILACGATVVPINFLLKPEEIEYILLNSESSFLISTSSFLNPIGPILGHHEKTIKVISVGDSPGLTCESWKDLVESGREDGFELPSVDIKEDVASCLYTSGTTGHPKGVMLTHNNLLSNTWSVYRALKGFNDDRMFCALPLFYTFATTVCFLTPLLHGLSTVLVERFVPHETLRLIAESRSTIFAGVPAMYAVWSSMNLPDLDFSRWRIASSGGAALPAEVKRAFEAKYPVPIYEGDGPTECSPVTSVNPIGGKRKECSIGLPIPDVEMKIFDDEGKELGPNEIGEIVVRGPNIMKGYWKNPEATREALKYGWLHTGDIGKCDDEGYFYILDRKKDMVIVGGMNVYSREVEEVLYRHPAVKEAAVVAAPDRLRGEIPKAFVVLNEGSSLTKRDLIHFAKPHLADYKMPRSVEFCESLPRSAQGKILKKVLRERAKEKEARDATVV